MSIRWGIIGTGEIAYEVAYAIAHLPGHEISCVSSGKEQNAKNFKTHFGLAHHHGSAEDLFLDPAVDIVYIAVPTHLHAALAVKALQSGKHVLCEKPLASSAAEAEQIRAAARESGKFCMEAMWIRFMPAMRELLQRASEGAIGELQYLNGSFGHASHRNSEGEPRESIIADLGVYLISMATDLMGRPESATALVHSADPDGYHQASLQLSYPSGALASFQLSYLTELNNEFSLHGSKGLLSLKSPFYRSGLLKSRHFHAATSGSSSPPNYYQSRGPLRFLPFAKRILEQGRVLQDKAIAFKGSGYHYQIEEVGRCLKQGLTESPLLPLAHSQRVLQIIDQLKQA